jgi:anti-sigma factor RsiW
MPCTESLTTQAFFDGALEGAAADAQLRHIEGCTECAQLMADLDVIGRSLKTGSFYRSADAGLRARVERALAAETRPRARAWRAHPRAFWTGLLNGALIATAAAAAFFFLVLAPESDELANDVTAAHIRSLVGTHLVDVSTSDPIQARGWLKAHAGLAFDTAAPAGFRLIGVRADYVYESGAAVAVYRGESKTVNVFAWNKTEDEPLPQQASARGYNVVFWKRGNIVFCAVSNLPASELEKFARQA